jgi:hypothetical protein
VAHIARQLDELVVNRSCRDQQVKIGYGYELALATKAGADASKALHDGIIECRQREAGEEPAKTSELGHGTRVPTAPFSRSCRTWSAVIESIDPSGHPVQQDTASKRPVFLHFYDELDDPAGCTSRRACFAR